MNISLKGHTYTTKHLEAWYHAILTQNVKEAQIQFQEAKKEHKEMLLKENRNISTLSLILRITPVPTYSSDRWTINHER